MFARKSREAGTAALSCATRTGGPSGKLLRGVIVNAFIEKIVDEFLEEKVRDRKMVLEVDPVTGAVTYVDVPQRG